MSFQLGLRRCVRVYAWGGSKEPDGRSSDLVSVGLLTRLFPPALVHEVIAEAGRTEQRHRVLPAQVMAYFCAHGQLPLAGPTPGDAS
jgi:hypothetical protein